MRYALICLFLVFSCSKLDDSEKEAHRETMKALLEQSEAKAEPVQEKVEEGKNGDPMEALAALERESEWLALAEGAKKLRPTLEDPSDRGWTIFWEFKALRQLLRRQEALDLFFATLGSTPGLPEDWDPEKVEAMSEAEKKKYRDEVLIISITNAAWMHSVALELAMLVKDKEAFYKITPGAMFYAGQDVGHSETIPRNIKIMEEQMGWKASK